MYLDKLNKEQLKAVKTINGPVRLIAGPGSGKTKTIISKIAYILDKKLAKPEEILVFSFTNKASNEIKERVNSYIDYDVKNIFTYHSWAANFLRKEAKRLGINPDYKILDSYDQTKMIKEIIKENEIETIDHKEAVAKFSSYALNKENIEYDKAQGEYFKGIVNLYNLYNERKIQSGVFDFDDLLMKVRGFLQTNSKLIDIYKNKYKYIFVDEFQDTNQVQYDILKAMTSKDSLVTVVGDPDQNIYSWRGSDIDIILNFDKDYNNVKTIILSKNYRSSRNIVKASNSLINKNTNRITFDVESIFDDGAPVSLIEGESSFDEGRKVVHEILYLKKKQGVPFDKMAIIYRNNYISRTFESELLKRNIQYQLIGGFKFYERKEVKEALFFLSFLNKKDDFSFLNIINVPSRGVGPKAIQILKKHSEATTQTLFESANDQNYKAPTKLIEFLKISNKYIGKFNKKNAVDLLKDFLDEIGFTEYYSFDENKSENIDGLYEQLTLMFKNFDTVEELLGSIAISSSSDTSSKEGHVTLITSHASKGLEFDTVFFVGVNEGVIPSYRAKSTRENEEERRIAYVSITRAMKRLYISYSLGFHFITKQEKEPSIFINDLKNELNNYNYNGVNKMVAIPGGFSKNNKDVYPGDIIYHKTFGKGTVINIEDKFFSVFFESGHGQKELMTGHPSYYKKQ